MNRERATWLGTAMHRAIVMHETTVRMATMRTSRDAHGRETSPRPLRDEASRSGHGVRRAYALPHMVTARRSSCGSLNPSFIL
jgi:hypothetical protein